MAKELFNEPVSGEKKVANLYDPKDFIATRKVGEAFDSSKRKKVEIIKDNVGHWQKGTTYDMFYQKADYLISKGLAKEVK